MNVGNNKRVFASSNLFKRNAATGIIISGFGIFPMGSSFLDANSKYDAVFYALIFVFLLYVLISSICALIRCRIIVSDMIITVQLPFHNEEIYINKYDSYDIINDDDTYRLVLYNTKNKDIKKQLINVKMIEDTDGFSSYISEYLVLGEKDIKVKKRFFPGIETLEERKKFAVFHACTLIISPLGGAVFLFLINLPNTSISSLVTADHWRIIFSDVRGWLIWSLFCWNFIGSWRFCDDTDRNEGFLVGRAIFLFCIIFFPFIYIYNLLCIMIKIFNDKETD